MRPYGATFLASLPPAPRTLTLPVRFVSLRYHPPGNLLRVWYDARLFIDLSTKTHANSGIDTATEACSVALWNDGTVNVILSFALVNILNESYRWCRIPDHQRNFPD